ncbi:Protein phosphatase type 2C 3 [Bacidia gigantensis]|uniref:Protein phosphatase type 2C 3 n=1 Tax=Bacidia gigantensis TaxID=2732470 RepID=UPI001D04F57F|nr:Protein phosphatase type 2C 3 [Bacidia gigantensis]KAG8528048.1 Protein phosphatase type 2C 3 [Bacidia gigantensis]
MGQTLSEPVVEKVSDDGQDDRVAFGVSAMQGWRISMEDAHAAILDLQIESDKEFQAASPDDRVSFFGVYDGHGGDKVAQFAGENIHKILAKQEAFKTKDFEQALKDGFLATDRAILSDPKYEEEVSGCTASVGLISKTTIYVANAGDSRTVLGVRGRAKPLSYDHKPQNEGEKARICAAGGFVDFGRVNGNLALSRAIGDFEFKKSADLSPEQQIVTAFPDVLSHTITDDDEFLVIACDGIWDCQSSQAVVEFVRRGIAAKQELSKISENMMDNCLASNSETGGVGCDNMTMIVVALLRGKSKDEWYQDISDRVAKGDGPCAPLEYAEFRGPGVRHQFEDSGDDYDMDLNNTGRGRIIFLGDGTEVLTDGDDAGEDKDAETSTSNSEPVRTEEKRADREETPGPEPQKSAATHEKHETMDTADDTAKPLTSDIEKPKAAATIQLPPNAIPETALPEKIVGPTAPQGQ